MAKDSWFKIEARQVGNFPEAHAHIEIYDEIGGWGITAKDFKDALTDLGDVSDIEVAIHSPGGSVLDGWAIFNILKNHPAKVRARIDGLAASMATVIAMAADTVEMPENAFFMIHNPSGVSIGDADEMRDYADLLEKMGDGIAKAYASKTGQDVDYIKSLMAQESWFTGQEAKDLGFVDTVTDALEMAALNGVIDECRAELEKAGLSLPVSLVKESLTEDEDFTNKSAVCKTNNNEEGTVDNTEEEDVDAGGELEEGDEGESEEADEAPEADAETEESENEEASDAQEDSGGFVDRVKAALLGRGGADARAEMAQLRGKYDDLKAELSKANCLLDDARDLNAAQEIELVDLRAERTTVIDLVTEAGFAPDEAASLPMPDSDEGVNRVGATIREQFDAITDPDERTAFYQKHKTALLHS